RVSGSQPAVIRVPTPAATVSTREATKPSSPWGDQETRAGVPGVGPASTTTVVSPSASTNAPPVAFLERSSTIHDGAAVVESHPDASTTSRPETRRRPAP